MKKNTLKYFINALLFIDISSIAVLGLLLGVVIPRGGHQADKYFLGLHRHEWGDIHLYLSLLLLVLLFWHVWLNWTWVVQSTQRYFGNRWKKVLWGLSGGWLAVITTAWMIARLS